jgi:hypothetical protein
VRKFTIMQPWFRNYKAHSIIGSRPRSHSTWNLFNVTTRNPTEIQEGLLIIWSRQNNGIGHANVAKGREEHRNPRNPWRSIIENREIFIQPISTQICQVKRGFLDPWKIVPLKWITLSRAEISQFLQGIFPSKNVCRTSANILVLVLRFLWEGVTTEGEQFKRKTRWRKKRAGWPDDFVKKIDQKRSSIRVCQN